MVVKQAAREDEIFSEWVALKLLSECFEDSETSPVPLFFGGDRTIPLLVMEDLGSESRLEDILMGKDYEFAHQAVVAFGRCIGKVHSRTIAKKVRYDEIYSAIGNASSMPSAGHPEFLFKLPVNTSLVFWMKRYLKWKKKSHHLRGIGL